ncbi:MAG: multiheme c-type cytochrome [Methanosarcinales archaeon]
MRKLILFLILYIGMIGLAQSEYNSSRDCIECHRQIYDQWSHAMHSQAITDPIFESAYHKAINSDPELKEYCLECHAPTTRVTKDFDLSQSISVEGVTCTFCHTVQAVDPETHQFTLDPGNTMRGPYRDSNTSAHESEYSEIHTKSEFCAGCHEFSINGVPVFQTYSEWKNSFYAEIGKQCQDCHMEPIRAQASNKGPIREKVYQHLWYGGHMVELIKKCCIFNIDLEYTDNIAKIKVTVKNMNVGHDFPTGFPTRKVILKVWVNEEQGKTIFEDSKTYTKTLGDENGNLVYDFWQASQILSDNRIKQGEKKEEFFTFEVPEGVKILNTGAKLYYLFEPQVGTEQVSMQIDIAEVNKTLEISKPTETPKTSGFRFEVAILGLLLIYFIFSRSYKNKP